MHIVKMTEEYPRKPMRPSEDSSKFRRRMSNHNLTVDIDLARGGPAAARGDGAVCARVCPDSALTQQEVVEQGNELFQNFLVEEMQSRGMNELIRLVTPGKTRNSPASGPRVKNPVWVKAGRDLREMADAFSRTKQRQRLWHRAYGCTVFGFLLELFDWASIFFWITKGTLRLTSHVTELGLTSGNTLEHHQGVSMTTDYNNNSAM